MTTVNLRSWFTLARFARASQTIRFGIVYVTAEAILPTKIDILTVKSYKSPNISEISALRTYIKILQESISLVRDLVHTFSVSNILFWFFSDFRPVSLEMFPNCSFSLYDLVGTSTFWCNTEMSGHSHFFGSLNFHSRLIRIAQFGKEFGAYIFLGEYFILISRNILSNFIPKCSEIVHSTE